MNVVKKNALFTLVSSLIFFACNSGGNRNGGVLPPTQEPGSTENALTTLETSINTLENYIIDCEDAIKDLEDQLEEKGDTETFRFRYKGRAQLDKPTHTDKAKQEQALKSNQLKRQTERKACESDLQKIKEYFAKEYPEVDTSGKEERNFDETFETCIDDGNCLFDPALDFGDEGSRPNNVLPVYSGNGVRLVGVPGKTAQYKFKLELSDGSEGMDYRVFAINGSKFDGLTSKFYKSSDTGKIVWRPSSTMGPENLELVVRNVSACKYIRKNVDQVGKIGCTTSEKHETAEADTYETIYTVELEADPELYETAEPCKDGLGNTILEGIGEIGKEQDFGDGIFGTIAGIATGVAGGIAKANKCDPAQ